MQEFVMKPLFLKRCEWNISCKSFSEGNPATAIDTVVMCDLCGHSCKIHAGLVAHSHIHRRRRKLQRTIEDGNGLHNQSFSASLDMRSETMLSLLFNLQLLNEYYTIANGLNAFRLFWANMKIHRNHSTSYSMQTNRYSKGNAPLSEIHERAYLRKYQHRKTHLDKPP